MQSPTEYLLAPTNNLFITEIKLSTHAIQDVVGSPVQMVLKVVYSGNVLNRGISENTRTICQSTLGADDADYHMKAVENILEVAKTIMVHQHVQLNKGLIL